MPTEQVMTQPYQLVLVFGPAALDQNGVHVLLPAMQALALAPPLEHSDVRGEPAGRPHRDGP